MPNIISFNKGDIGFNTANILETLNHINIEGFPVLVIEFFSEASYLLITPFEQGYEK
ncbi:hypothetical protein [Dethiothermospora halolimnae]|uniref:hypothetical protein n=1 Tax=Dethiothermospora halolimnae TaxID=3114390 RepID=UPI003CCBA87A